MNVLVTGATGFVGRRLVGRLSRSEGCAVRAAVRPSATNVPPIDDVVRIPDLAAGTDWSAALRGIDAVVHLAARVHVMRDAAADPLAEFRRINVDGTMTLARQAAAAGVRRFVFVSSIKVNGEATVAGRPFTESDPRAPLDPYGISKAEAEVALLALAASSAMEVTIIRPPLVYGPGVKANFRRMAGWLARGVPLPLGSLTGNRRSLIAVDNLVDLIETCLRHPAAANEVFLASDGEDLSTAELLRRTAAAMGAHARLLPFPVAVMTMAARLSGKGHVVQRLAGNLQVDSGKARSVLAWTPPLGVNEGLRLAVADMRPGRSP